jgi:hypothetical protein
MWWTIRDAMSRSRAASRSASEDPTRLPMALALARERVTAAHIGQAVELVELSRGRMTPGRAIEIYCRLALLGPSPAEEVRVRALAALADARADERESSGMPERVAWRRGRLDSLRRRRDEELRDWVDMHAARSRSVVIEAHVRSAIEFVEILAGQLNRPQAIAFYLQMGHVPGHLEREVVTFALERLARRHLPLPIRGPDDDDPDAAEYEDPDVSREAGGGGGEDEDRPVSREAGGGGEDEDRPVSGEAGGGGGEVPLSESAKPQPANG